MHQQMVQAVAPLLINNPDSLEEAVILIRQAVYCMTLGICRHREDAEDATQEVLSRSLKNLGKFQDANSLAVWLYIVTRNDLRRRYRKTARCPAKLVSLDSVPLDKNETVGTPSDARMSPEATLLRHKEAHLLWRAILRAPRSLRLVLVLHDLKEFTTPEVAEILRLKQGRIRVRRKRPEIPS